MPVYKAPLTDIRFILDDVLDFAQISNLPGYEEATPDLINAILEEGGKVCEEVFFPLNLSGDQEGCTFKDGEVTTPKGFKEAYDLYAESGWNGLSSDPQYGGQGMPQTLSTIMAELISSANLSFGMYPGLTQGAMNALKIYGTDEQKQTYLPPMIEGRWSGTMNLTEPHCGTDLGLIRTKAEDNNDGSYAITGTKIYISAGEHDLCENIIHLVLARLPDAPEGVKGISLFVVPKFMPKEDGSIGERNTLACGSIEHKMGIHANSTCVMNYEGAKGWLVGEPHKGLRAMFVMMNEARLHVGMQGLGIAEVAYQNAVSYAKERLQGRALSGPKYPEKAADPILVHPDIRKGLMRAKAFTEGARMLAIWTAMKIDIEHKTTDPQEKQEADDFIALMTPIIKAYFTDMGFEVANIGIQTHGGMGFIAETGVEQYARDARITMIYEGTNGIQALDLVGRKMAQHFGRSLRQFFHPAQAFIEENQTNEDLSEFIFPFAKAFAKLQQASIMVATNSLKNRDEAGAASTDYLRMFALNVMALCWLKMIKVAQEKIAANAANKKFYETKIKTGRFFFEKMLPEANSCFTSLSSGTSSIMALDEDAFDRA